MKKRAAIFAATLLTLVGAVSLVLYQERFEEEASGGAMVPVLFAAQDLELGTVLQSEYLGIREIPERYVEPRHIPASEVDRVLGLRVSSEVRHSESLLWTDLANSEQRRDLSRLVQPGQRAFTIRADVSSSFGGLLRPGDRVDVLVTVERGQELETAPIAQNLLVLATGGDTGQASGGAARPATRAFQQVTVSASLEQTQTLALAQRRGQVSLVLRNPDDIQIVDRAPPQTSQRLLESIRSGTEAP